jgi:lactoylglutathione lyase
VTNLDHIGLSVSDVDAAASFYESAFGFAAEFPFELPGAIRGLMMRASEGHRIELFQAADAQPGITAATPLEALGTRGYGHFALAAGDIDPVYERALAAGARGVVSPSPSPEPGVRFAFLADPEGNLVELVERRDGSGA